MGFRCHRTVTGHVFTSHPATFDVSIEEEDFYALHKQDAGRLDDALVAGGLVIASHFTCPVLGKPVVTVVLRPEQVSAETFDMISHLLRAHILMCKSEMGKHD